jgi:hypothetical protein
MGTFGLPPAYVDFNSSQTKNPVIVVVIDGVPKVFANRGFGTQILYGDPGVLYGGPGINYGGMRPFSELLPNGDLVTVLDYLELNTSNPSIAQHLDPEQGKASVSTLTLSFIDKDNYLTQVCSPGIIIPEIMGAEITVYLGYLETSYPLDYFQIFRGYCTSVDSGPGLIQLQISDPNLKMRQTLFYTAQDVLVSAMGVSDLIFSITNNVNFFQQIPQITGGSYNQSIHTYALIDSEWIECIPILPGSEGYTASFQGIVYTAVATIPVSTTYTTGASISVQYLSGGTAGSETVLVTGQAIQVTLESGVSTASQVAFAIQQSVMASELVTPMVIAGDESLAQTTQIPTYLTLTTYYALVVEGILYLATPGSSTPIFVTYANTVAFGSEFATVTSDTIYTAVIDGVTYTATPPHTNDVSITYIGGGVAGSEVVTSIGAAITVQIQVNVSTAAQVAFAINQSGVTVLATATVNPALAGQPQVTQGPTFLSATAGDLITVNIDSGVSTNVQVIAALNAIASSVAPLVNYQTLPTLQSQVVSSYAVTPLAIGIAGSQMAVISRGARSTAAATHDVQAAVAAGLQVGDRVFTENAIDMALKIMLSGWNGPWITGVEILSIGPEPDSMSFITTTNFITLPSNIDAVADYGLVAGDFISVQESAVSSNNNVYLQIVRFADFNGQSNRLIYLNGTLTKEQDTPATASFRSQYDVYPVDAGLRLTPKDVDIAQHLYIKQTFLGTNGNDLIFFITSAETSGKDFISSQIYLPIGAYSLTRYGKLSVNYHSPPIANQSILTLNKDNILKPDQIHITRALNNRAFYDEIDLTYNYDDSGNALSNVAILDAPSYDLIQVDTALPIDARGVYQGYSSNLLIQRANFLLLRYKRGAVMLKLTINWEAGSVCEVGDIALIQDSDGVLQISNFNTGERGLGNVLFEVIDRSFNIKEGNVAIQLVGNIGASVTDRFAVISPSSIVGTGSTTNQVIITDSFGALFPGDESKKYELYVGQQILVHSFDYSVMQLCTLESIDTANIYMLHVSTLGFTPLPGYIVDIPDYPTSVDPTINELYKLVHCFLDPTVVVVTGVDERNFTVSSGDISKFTIGLPVRIHNYNYSKDSSPGGGGFTVTGASSDLSVTAIDTGTNTITVNFAMGFVADNTCFCDLIGFEDANAKTGTGFPYRFI